MNKFYKLALSAIVVGFTLSSCTKEDVRIKGAFEDGIFISNEGAFGKGNASVSFINSEGEVQQGIFKATNSRDLGDTFQSMIIEDGKAYMVLNNSNKVEIVNSNTFKEEGVIDNLTSPRYIIKKDKKLYISQWGNHSVESFDVSSLKRIATISVGVGPEGLISVNDEVWVANSGGWATDKTISVIKTSDNSVTTIALTGDNPKKMVVDSDGDVWVLCAGNVIYNTDYSILSQTPSKLIEIDASTKTIKKEIKLSETVHYGRLSINSDNTKLYYGGGYGVKGIYEISTTASAVPSSALVSGSYYGFVIGEKAIYGTVAPSFTANGSVEKYDFTGKKLNTYEAGIGPNGVVFNN